MNDGNDTFIQSDGSVLTGTADGGSGFDTLKFNNMGVVDGFRYLNFESLEILGGNTTLTGLWNLADGMSPSDTEESLTSALGLKAISILHKADWRFLPRAGIALAHQFKDDPVQLTANFVGYREAAFTVSGAEPSENQVLANLGVTVEYSRSLSMYFDLAADVASGQDDTLLTGGLAWNF